MVNPRLTPRVLVGGGEPLLPLLGGPPPLPPLPPPPPPPPPGPPGGLGGGGLLCPLGGGVCGLQCGQSGSCGLLRWLLFSPSLLLSFPPGSCPPPTWPVK
jgi:hypothetical protein